MDGSDPRTPTGIQAQRLLYWRRSVFVALNVATYGLLCGAMSRIADAGGWTGVDVLMLVSFALAVPWSVVGFWNAVIGLWALCLDRRSAWVAPFAPVAARRPRAATAVVMTLRNEDPGRAFRRLRILRQSLDATGFGDAFHVFVLSDTAVAAIAEREAALVEEWKADLGRENARITYRRRTDNVGFKGGNLLDFCQRWGDAFEFMLLLDADSLMSGATVLDLVAVAEANPRLGIAQTLPIGLPAATPFARLFQFGMRHGLRTYMAGAAWWAADCGSFWGHNALVRIAPLVAHCRLPVLPGKPPWGGPIMAHDQVEAALMRRAGFEVRVFAREAGSYEDAPPDLVAYTTRDLRWCQGNLQYWRLLATPGLIATSRFQLFWAAMMFYGMPATYAFLLLVASRPLLAPPAAAPFPTTLAILLYVCVLLMGPMPKLVGYLGIALGPGGIRRHGGAARLVCGCLAELLVSFMVKAVTEFRVSLFMVALVFGRCVVWSAQSRDARSLAWTTATTTLWPATAFGVAVLALLCMSAPHLVVWSLPVTAGLVLAIPLAVVTASPRVGAWCRRVGLCATPEERDPPAEIRALMGAAEPFEETAR